MAGTGFWLFAYWILVPLVGVAFALGALRTVRETYGQPALVGRLLFHDGSVKATTPARNWPATYGLWITDQEVVLRLRPQNKASMYAGRLTRIPVENIASVQSLADGKVRLGLTGGEGRYWDLASASGAKLFQALQALAP